MDTFHLTRETETDRDAGMYLHYSDRGLDGR